MNYEARSETGELRNLIDDSVREIPARFPEIDANYMRLAMTLRTTSNLIQHDLGRRLEACTDLSVNEVSILFVILTAGTIELRDLIPYAGLKKATASTLIDRLVNKGMVNRTQSTTDRRVVTISITEAGIAEFRRAFDAYHQGERFWMSKLDESEARTLLGLLDKRLSTSRNNTRQGARAARAAPTGAPTAKDSRPMPSIEARLMQSPASCSLAPDAAPIRSAARYRG